MYNYNKLAESEVDYIAITEVENIPPGERLFLELDSRSIVIFNIAGQLFAIEDLCSHDDGPLGDGELEGLEIICPRHGARFDIKSGKVLALPAVDDIPAYPVRVHAGQVEIGLPK